MIVNPTSTPDTLARSFSQRTEPPAYESLPRTGDLPTVQEKPLGNEETTVVLRAEPQFNGDEKQKLQIPSEDPAESAVPRQPVPQVAENTPTRFFDRLKQHHAARRAACEAKHAACEERCRARREAREAKKRGCGGRCEKGKGREEMTGRRGCCT
ncbi:hypothetical protein DACRYDRAFT_21710 [Dacryopinax primogenitus]|uniref:Uncharacterized protein n=1 Tax=Dacryopinax primogenitus (strain DJM 731) TaxID=1858805 RepID=M5G3C0_DACPD|nr:uncharacterized protein DACRYDRAFT_21710 [Dacryopinax primogenitus]EJU02715.1 hypothetical protein DACRYDRAFT_21710 [Dacryopinax primogenitus]